VDAPLPKAIFLDLDDTIVDDSSSVDTGWTLACQEAGSELQIDPFRLKETIFVVRDWYWSDADRHREGRQNLRAAGTWIVDEALRRLGIEAPGLGAAIANRYRDFREEGIDLLPGALNALASFRQAGIRLALLTNGSSAGQRAKIDRFDLARHFDHISIEGEAGFGKPDERVYYQALSALGCRPEETWMVGDNLDWDVLAPMKLGLKGIWLDRFQSGLPADSAYKPDRIILRLDELP
jgi:putative hydrolase of the HAD superfamily